MNETMENFVEYLAVKNLSVSSIKQYLTYYKIFDEGLENEELTQSYINRFLLQHTSGIARAFVKHIIEFFEIPNLKIPKISGRKPKKKRRNLTNEDIDVLDAWLRTNKRLDYALCLRITDDGGLRRGEATGIIIKDFDLDKWEEDPTRPCKLLIRGKGKKQRYVQISPKTMNILIDYLLTTDKTKEDRLFSFHFTGWNRVFKEAVKSTMDEEFTLHDLRRSRATEWINQGIDLSRVKTRLGHESVSTTQLYVNLDEKKELEKWAEEY